MGMTAGASLEGCTADIARQRREGWASGYDLHAPWPDSALRESYRELLDIYRRLCSGARAQGTRDAFVILCWSALPAPRATAAAEAAPVDLQRRAVGSLVERLRSQHPDDWLQRFASLLGMLMHFAVTDRGKELLVNRRRPGKPFSTYPTSPALARLLGDATLAAVTNAAVPAGDVGAREAERFARRHLAVRVLDPSMESGQLLVAVAQALVLKVGERHHPASNAARHLLRAGLRRLCNEGLWGIDRNRLGAVATRCVFSLLGAELGLEEVVPRNLIVADALRPGLRERLPPFDAVINNPPWGEAKSRGERDEIRHHFSTSSHHIETYVAFTELAQRSLRPGGAFALVLPGQAVASVNAAGLRQMLVEQTQLEQLVVLPRAPFVDATVRAVVLSGRAGPAESQQRGCTVTAFSLAKRLDLVGPARTSTLPAETLRRYGRRSWWPLINGDRWPTVESIVPLDDVGRVVLGVQLYRRGLGRPPQTAAVVRRQAFTFKRPVEGSVAAVRGREVDGFALRQPSRWIQLGEWLAYPGDHQRLLFEPRIFVRELCRRDGRLNAAASEDGRVPLHGVLTVLPLALDRRVLLALLNSSLAASWVRTHASSFVKVDFQKITVSELRRLPVPAATVRPEARRGLRLHRQTEEERTLCEELIAVVEEATNSGLAGDDRSRLLDTRLDPLVNSLYGVGAER